MPAMTDDTIPLFSFPAVQGKKVTAAFDIFRGRAPARRASIRLAGRPCYHCVSRELLIPPSRLGPSGPSKVPGGPLPTATCSNRNAFKGVTLMTPFVLMVALSAPVPNIDL